MSDEIKKEPVDDPKPVKELSADELRKVNCGLLNDPFLDAVQTAAASIASEPLKKAANTRK